MGWLEQLPRIFKSKESQTIEATMNKWALICAGTPTKYITFSKTNAADLLPKVPPPRSTKFPIITDVFLMVRRKKTTIFTNAKETTSVRELKKIVQGILKVSPDNQRLSNEKGSETFEDDKQLSYYNFTAQTAKAQSPSTIGLALRMDNGEFETLEIVPVSSPPELPEVMKPADSQTHDQNRG